MVDVHRCSKLDLQRCLQAVEKDSLATKARGDVITSMLPLIDNFERASGQIKAETEQEQKIDAAYQVRNQISICFTFAGMHCCLCGSTVHISEQLHALMANANIK